MRSAVRGRNTSSVEVTNVGPTGFWLLLEGREIFLSYKEFPWFHKAQVAQLFEVEFFPPEHLYWPKLDVDISANSIEHPERYPLKFKSKP